MAGPQNRPSGNAPQLASNAARSPRTAPSSAHPFVERAELRLCATRHAVIKCTCHYAEANGHVARNMRRERPGAGDRRRGDAKRASPEICFRARLGDRLACCCDGDGGDARGRTQGVGCRENRAAESRRREGYVLSHGCGEWTVRCAFSHPLHLSLQGLAPSHTTASSSLHCLHTSGRTPRPH